MNASDPQRVYLQQVHVPMCAHTIHSTHLKKELGVITEEGKATWAPESRSMKKPADLRSLEKLKSLNSI